MFAQVSAKRAAHDDCRTRQLSPLSNFIAAEGQSTWHVGEHLLWDSIITGLLMHTQGRRLMEASNRSNTDKHKRPWSSV